MLSMINGEVMSAQHPDTFQIPSLKERQSLRPGDHAKIGMTGHSGGERFWVKITEVSGSRYKGAVDNDLIVVPMKLGEEVEFGPEHVLSTLLEN